MLSLSNSKWLFTALLIPLLCAGFFMLNSPDKISVSSASSFSDSCFSIMQITDTQYISWLAPSLFYDQTSWIVNNSQDYNLKMVIHTGDFVDTPTHTSEWEVANTAMMTLYSSGIPYCWDAGNHDQLPPNSSANLWLGDSNTGWLGSQYPAFNQTIMRQKPYWVADIYDGKNTAVAFNYLNYRFLIVNLEFLANSSAIDWLQTLIKCNPTANVIVATHDYLNRTGGYGTRSISNSGVLDYTWGNDFKALLDQYPNVFLTLSGHIQSRTTGAYNQRVGDREEIFFNRQELNNKTGAASVRIYTFNMTSMQVSVSTYALDTQTWLTDSLNQFNFSASLKAYSPSTVIISSGTRFWGSSGYSIAFSGTVALDSFSQYGDTITFNKLTLNGVTSSFAAATNGADVVISNYDLNGWLNYTVAGSGTQVFSVNKAPVSVYIDGLEASDGWSYSNRTLTVTGASSSASLTFEDAPPAATPVPSSSPKQPEGQNETAPSPSPPVTPNPPNPQFDPEGWLAANWLIVVTAIAIAILAITFDVRHRRLTRLRGSRHG